MFNSSNFLIPKDVLAYLSRSKELLRSLCQAKLSYYQTARQRCVDESLANNVIIANNHDSVHSNPTTPTSDEEPVGHRHTHSFSIRQGLRSLFVSPKTPRVRGYWTGGIPHIHSESHVLDAEGSHSLPSLPHVHSNNSISSLSDAKESTWSHFHLQVESSLFNISRAIALVALQFSVILKSDHKDVAMRAGS